MLLIRNIRIISIIIILPSILLHILFFLPTIANSSLSFQVYEHLVYIKVKVESLISKDVSALNHQSEVSLQCKEGGATKDLKESATFKTLVNYFATSPNCLEGKTILITGASKGIGKALVRESARLGASNIVIASRNEQKLQEVKESIYTENISTPERTSIHIIPVDLSSKDQCNYLIEETVNKLPSDNKNIDFL